MSAAVGLLRCRAFEDEEPERLEAEVDEAPLAVREVAAEAGTHHALPSRPMDRVKLLQAPPIIIQFQSKLLNPITREQSLISLGWRWVTHTYHLDVSRDAPAVEDVEAVEGPGRRRHRLRLHLRRHVGVLHHCLSFQHGTVRCGVPALLSRSRLLSCYC